ncbi:hypothetical protein AURDEDRAFT_184140 [Auricularia subglabra TFB-10046 SS5]|nr:hypothetical protein AURDEDRAFT_184140 [Auricularia subglabra TFB-10046 SS5]
MDVQELKVKVLYTLAPNTTAVMALTRRVPVTLIPSENPGELGHGKVLLRHCLLAICHSNPDLIGDAAKDYSVYALDPLEPVHAPLALPAHVSKTGSSSSSSPAAPAVGGTAVGLGLMSWCLDAGDEDADDEDAPFVIGSLFAHPVMGCGLQVFLTLHEMAARSKAQHGSLMKQWSTPAPAKPTPKPTPYTASSPVLAPQPPAKRPAPKSSKPKKAAPAAPTPAPAAMFVPHPHHAPYYAPPWGAPPELQAAVLLLQQQHAAGQLADADPALVQQLLGAVSRFLPVPMVGSPAPIPMPMAYPPTPMYHPRQASSTPGPPPYQAVPPPAQALLPPPPPRRKASTSTPAPARPTTPVQQALGPLHATTPEPILNVQYTLPRPSVSVQIGSQREREKENIPSSSSSSNPLKRRAEPLPAESAPNKRPSPDQRFHTGNGNGSGSGIADSTNTFVRPATPKAHRPPPPQSSSPLFSTTRMLRAGSSDPTLVVPMTSSPPRSMLSSPTLAQKKFAVDLPPSSPLPEDESSCSSAITTPGEPDDEDDEEMEEINPFMQQSDQDLCEELFGQWA